MSANKFLGLDSINVITEYIKQYVNKKQEESQVITLQVYKYSSEQPQAPTNDTHYDFENNSLIPDLSQGANAWNKLSAITDYLVETYGSVNAALEEGSIWMSSGLQYGSTVESWSTPMKVSGENGKAGVQFAFSYKKDTPEKDRSLVPLDLEDTDEKRTIYYWMKNIDGEWIDNELPGKVWARFTQNGVSGMKTVFQYHLTGIKDVDKDDKPIAPKHNSEYWTNGINYDTKNGFSKDIPYLWLRHKTIKADETIDMTDPNANSGWSEIVLFSHYGQDGNVPDYNITLYHIGKNSNDPEATPGIICPDKIILTEPISVEEFLAAEAEKEIGWRIIPKDEELDERTIWWQCTIKVNGKDMTIDSQEDVGQILRYNQVSPEATPGQFTKYLFKWSENQTLDEDLWPKHDKLIDHWKPNGWDESMSENALNDPNASVWVIAAQAFGYNDAGYPKIGEFTEDTNPWSEPIKLTGPRGPMSLDYRIETRYMEGTSAAPRALPSEEAWYKLDGKLDITSKDYPYIWAAEYLVSYRMVYSTNAAGQYIKDANGDYVMKPEDFGTLITNYGYYRLSGRDGEDGNRKNSLSYITNATENKALDVISFADTNFYIANSTEAVVYNIKLDSLTFVNGYTGKFSNMGAGKVTIQANNFTLVNGDKTARKLELSTNETVELVCYNDATLGQCLLVLGKSL